MQLTNINGGLMALSVCLVSGVLGHSLGIHNSDKVNASEVTVSTIKFKDSDGNSVAQLSANKDKIIFKFSGSDASAIEFDQLDTNGIAMKFCDSDGRLRAQFSIQDEDFGFSIFRRGSGSLFEVYDDASGIHGVTARINGEPALDLNGERVK